MFVFRFYSLEFSNYPKLYIFQVWECTSRGRNCKWKLENWYDSFIDEDEINYQENEIGNILPPSKEQAKNTDRLLVIIRHEMQNVWFWIRQPTWTWLLVQALLQRGSCIQPLIARCASLRVRLPVRACLRVQPSSRAFVWVRSPVRELNHKTSTLKY
jgi:hypothetical protein